MKKKQTKQNKLLSKDTLGIQVKVFKVIYLSHNSNQFWELNTDYNTDFLAYVFYDSDGVHKKSNW